MRVFDPVARRPIAVRFPPCGVFVLESHHARGFRMASVRHDYLKLILPFAGRGWLVRSGCRTPLVARDMVVVPAGTIHHIEDDGAQPLALYALCLATRPFAGADSTLSRFRHFAAPIWSGELRSLIRHVLHEQTLKRPGGELMITGLAWQALGHLVRAAANSRAPVIQSDRPAKSRVAAYAADLARTFYRVQSVDAAAASLGLSRRHFTQLFREVTGASWLDALRRHRLAHARRLLRETNRSVLSICYECGFQEITTFYRAFRASEKSSPLAWRKS